MAVKKNPVGIIALGLIILGALNWLLIGAFNFNFVTAIFGSIPIFAKIIYIIIGIAGIVAIVKFKSI